MSDPPPNRDKTLGGVQRTKFAPNLAARRNKKEGAGPHKLHRLLAEGRDTQAAGTSSAAPADRYGVRSPPAVGRGRGKGASEHGGRGGGRGGGGGGGSSQGGSHGGGDWSSDVPMHPVKLDASDPDSRPPSRVTRSHSRSWLELPNAPLTLPLRPLGPDSRPGSSASGRATPGSRPASRLGGGRWDFPDGSAAAALLGGAAGMPTGAAARAAPDQLFFVHLPSALPVRPSAPKPPGAPPTVSGTEYIAALARGDGCEEGGVCGFGVGGGSFRGGGAAEGSPPLATLEDMEAGTQGELLVYKSGKVVWSLHGFLLELQQGAPCSFDQEIVALRQPPDADGGEGALVTVGAPTGKASAVPMHLYRLGRMAHRLVVTPDVPSLLQRCAAERAAGI